MNRYVAAVTNRLTRVFLPQLHARMREEQREREKLEFRAKAALWNNEIQRILNKIIAESGVYVRSGPFKGMMFWPIGVPGYWSGGLAPSLLGVYERELHESLQELTQREYEHVINVGCAEGYYAVGLALRLPRARVFAFDMDQKSRQLCDAMAVVNAVSDRVVVDGECTVERLGELTMKRSLIVCDCEGCEVQLLKPELAPGLAQSDILVELHDILQPGITEQILPRFAATHDIRIVQTEQRDPTAFKDLAFLSLDERRQALDERRPGPMQWAVMSSRSKASH